MLPRKRDPIGDRLASLVFGNKMETDRDAENEPEFSASENPGESSGSFPIHVAGTNLARRLND
jgi:hypothetical protein